MKIFVTGTRGVPGIAGGVEKHCEELYPRIVAKGHEVYIATRIPYVSKKANTWNNVILKHIFAPSKKNIEAIVHTFLALVVAKKIRPDIVHIHAVGPGLLVPFAKLMGFKVVVTNHGPDYDRQKWGKIAKLMLRLGEYWGGKFSHAIIVISEPIREIIKLRCGKSAYLIYNGVNLPEKNNEIDFLEKYNLTSQKYLFAVARFVSEKGLHILVDAFQKVRPKGYKLVIAGDADHETPYSLHLKSMIAENTDIVATGYIRGAELNQLYSHAGLFVLPSFHEGLPIALLEAMSYDLSVLVSDIPANIELGLDQKRYFKCGSVKDLAFKIETLLQVTKNSSYQNLLGTKYNWDVIAEQTIVVYETVLKNTNGFI